MKVDKTLELCPRNNFEALKKIVQGNNPFNYNSPFPTNFKHACYL